MQVKIIKYLKRRYIKATNHQMEQEQKTSLADNIILEQAIKEPLPEAIIKQNPVSPPSTIPHKLISVQLQQSSLYISLEALREQANCLLKICLLPHSLITSNHVSSTYNLYETIYDSKYIQDCYGQYQREPKNHTYLTYLQYLEKSKDIEHLPLNHIVKREATQTTHPNSLKILQCFTFLKEVIQLVKNEQDKTQIQQCIIREQIHHKVSQMSTNHLVLQKAQQIVLSQKTPHPLNPLSQFKTPNQSFIQIITHHKQISSELRSSCKKLLQLKDNFRQAYQRKKQQIVRIMFQVGKCYLVINKAVVKQYLGESEELMFLETLFCHQHDQNYDDDGIESPLNNLTHFIIQLKVLRLNQQSFMKKIIHFHHQILLKSSGFDKSKLQLQQLKQLQKRSDISLKQTFDDVIHQAMKNIKAKIRGNVRTRRGRIIKASLQLPQQYQPNRIISQEDQTVQKSRSRKIIRRKRQGTKDEYKTQKLQENQQYEEYEDSPYVAGETYKIPIDLDEDSTAFYHFNISGKVITRLGGAWYQPMFLKYPLPQRGKHKIAVRIEKTERSIFWIGVIADYVKKLTHSSIWRDYFIYKVNSGQIISNIQGSQQKIRTKCQTLPVKGVMEMLIDMDLKQITFILSNGGVATAKIPAALLSKYKLVPFVCIYSTYDALQFLE